jgi:glycosyltransferase involved in cell wall biosynthesis
MGRTKVLVDAWHLSGDSAYRGIGTYLRNLLAHLGPRDDLAVSALTVAPTLLPPGIEPVRISRRAPGRFARREHELRLPRDLRRVAADVVHSPAQDPPKRCRVPYVQTLFDMTPLVVTEPALADERERLLRLAGAYRAAAAVIAISQHSAEKGIELLGLDPSRVHVVHLGVDARFRPPVAREPGGRPYVLYVGEYGAHKGFAEAFRVVAALAERGHPHSLKMVGRIAPWHSATIGGLRDAAPRADLVELLGFVDDTVALYQQADALIVTSRQEGFGLPVVEAMACGTPVIAFANSSLIEVVGDGGVLIPDGDVDAMAAAASELLGAPEKWQEASAKAQRRAASFNWGTTASRHADIYRSVARES